MSDLLETFESERLTHVSNYSGAFNSGASYQKFDFVYNTGDNLFYYAREDMVYGGGANLSGVNRFSLVPDGPYTSNGPSHYIVDSYNQLNEFGASFEVGQIINLEGSENDSDGLYKVLSVQQDVLELNNDPTLTGSVLNVVGVGASEINVLELPSTNGLSISEVNESPSENDLLWARDLFFFDADYGSTVNFRANNQKYEYGNGYYILQPKNINSLTLEADLKFKNRTNREANAIIHFLENHQGQHEQDRPSANLKYSQGISGFRWDGASTFHPYDNTEIQTKKFYCSDFNHSLNFENSNDVTVKLRNLDSSILQKQNGLFVAPADEYSDTEYYEKNDVVYNVDNKRFYYWSGDSSAAGKAPTQSQANWTRADGYHKDTNTEYWTREFFWKPSVGLNINQKPRLNEIGMGRGYTQIYDDGINESLLTLDLQFNNRSDTEAYAILHFLEQRLGYLPFSFSPPAPYDKKQNFVCQEWSHTYNYKNNHSISARFEQYPFNLSDQAYDNAVGPPIESDGELLFTSPAIIKGKDIGEELSLNTSIRGRVVLRNVGDKAVTLYSATITPEEQVTFKILGQSGGDVPILKKQLISSDYEYVLPPYSASVDLRGGTIDLNNKRIKLRKNFTGGLEGGYMFDLLDSPGGIFVQYNNGVIRSLDNPSEKIETNYFINEIFIQNNKTNILDGGEEAYIEIVFEGVNRSDLLYNLIDENGNRIQNVDAGGSQGDIVLFAENKYYNASLSISSSSKYGTKDGLVKVYVNVD